MKQLTDHRSLMIGLAIPALLVLPLGCEFNTPSFNNPLDPSVSVPLDSIVFDDPSFADVVYRSAEGPNTNDVYHIWDDNSGVTGLGGIEYLSNLQELRLHNSGVSSLLSVGQLRRLEQLEIDNANLTDISPLGKVSSLRAVMLRNNNISSLEPLDTLSRLERVALSGVNSWSGKYFRGTVEEIATLSQLRHVELSEFDIADLATLEPILGMPNLEGLGLDNGGLTEFPTGAAIRELRELRLSWNPITALPASSVSFSNLEHLSIQGLQLSDANYGGLENIRAPDLRWLDIGGNWVDDGFGGNAAPTTSIPDLSQYPALEGLSARDSEIVDISGISELTSLRNLDLSNQGTAIIDFSPLSNLTNLHDLHLGSTGFGDDDFQYLSGMSELGWLSLWGNPGITSFSGLESVPLGGMEAGNLESLTTLNLSQIDHIREVYLPDQASLSEVTGGTGAGIERLYLENGNAVDCSSLGNLTTLRELSLSGTPITDGAQELARLTNLYRLDLSGTGVPQADVDYLVEALPNCNIIR
ncbi:MAG: leucine-rich repeat domain-containing protein [Spirochaetaceae bacterium]